MELRANRRKEQVKLALQASQLLSKRMRDYHAGMIDDEYEIPRPGQMTDESMFALDTNYIRQQFEENVFHLFRNNTISAQTFIFQFTADQYPKFNTIFPMLYSQLSGGHGQLDVQAVYDMAIQLMRSKAPTPQTPRKKRGPTLPIVPALAEAVPATATATSKDGSLDLSQIGKKIAGKVQIICPLQGCNGKYKINDKRAKSQHEKSAVHQNALRVYNAQQKATPQKQNSNASTPKSPWGQARDFNGTPQNLQY